MRSSFWSNAAPPGFRRWPCPRAIAGALLAMLVGWIAGTSLSLADEPVASEYQVKAAFIINFPKYVEWPGEAFAATNSPIVIAVLGESRVTDELQKIIAGRSVNGRELVLKHLDSADGTIDCHLLFVPATEQKRAPNLLPSIKNKGILTVGESDDFLAGGGTINLARRNQKIALEVNLEAAGNSRIKISSKLLNIAKVVMTSVH
jgi:hypothetical protein